jgi:predicted acetyltransferase
MEPVLRPPEGEEETARVWHMLHRAFNFPLEDVERFASDYETPRGLALFVGDEVAAYSRIKPFAMFWGGRSVPTGGFSPVAVAPEFRGRGLGSRVTVGQYADMRDRGEVLAALYPASTRLYRAVGFELAGVWARQKLPTRSLQLLRPTGVTVRRATPADLPAVKALYAAVARHRNGHLDRTDWWWDRAFKEFDKVHLYVVDGDGPGLLAGYARYIHEPAQEWGYTISVHEVVAPDADVAAALWRLIGTSSTMAYQVKVTGPVEHPLLLLLPEQDLQPESELRFMIRLIDMPGAFAARGYPSEARVDIGFDVEDKDCPWNSGRWQLVVSDGEGRFEKGGDGAVRAVPHALAGLFSGYAAARTLAEAGLLPGAGDRDLAALTTAFAGPTPWMPDFF